MLTLKFGGTSMGSAQRILNSAEIIINQSKKGRLSVIVSAVAGVSNNLEKSIQECITGKPAAVFVQNLKDTHVEICREIQAKLNGFSAETVLQDLEPIFLEYNKLLTACTAFEECSSTIYARIMGMGEQLSSKIMNAVLLAKKQSVILLDSRKYIITAGNQLEGDPDYTRTSDALKVYRDGENLSQAHILLFPGFISSWIEGTGKEPVAGLLGRNGSDFSAAIIAYALGSEKIQFWTDVDGVYTADPRVVKDAILIKDMSYEEAMELAFFGSKVLHPKTLAPLAIKGIEAWSLNSKNTAARGTRIAKGPFESVHKGDTVRGISCLKNTSLISVGGPGMKGHTGMASRIFEAVARASISILLITQSSSEYTISFCVRDSKADKVKDVLTAEFDLEIKSNVLKPVEVLKECAIVSIVGDGMKKNRGIAGKFFNALASQDVNILAIAQGSSERCISTVIRGKYGDIAVRSAHRFFFNTSQSIEIFAFGAGTIGGALLDQIKDQQEALLKQNVSVKVIAIATVKCMLLSEDGLDLTSWREDLNAAKLKAKGSPNNVDEIIKFVQEKKPLNPVFVDCTASYDLPERYLDIFNAGMSIATPNKRANSMNIDFYHELRKTANKMHRRFLYETNVGAGLPIIDNLQNLYKSGDILTGFSGIMSGSLSYIFGLLDEGVPFSKAVLAAKEKKYTEPDPRDDLNGMDVARKALIIARESGYEIELEDIQMNKIFPDTFDLSGTKEEFIERLPQLDDYFAEKIETLKNQGKVLRMGASIKNGKCSVGILEVGKNNPLYGVKGGENAFVFHTERYNPIPLTIRGYGAGAGVTAAGVFGDILRTVSFNPEN